MARRESARVHQARRPDHAEGTDGRDRPAWKRVRLSYQSPRGHRLAGKYGGISAGNDLAAALHDVPADMRRLWNIDTGAGASSGAARGRGRRGERDCESGRRRHRRRAASDPELEGGTRWAVTV